MANQSQTMPPYQWANHRFQQQSIWRNLIGGGLKNVVLPVLVSVAVAFVTTTFMGQVQVTDSAAHAFLATYYSKVVHAGDRSYLFHNDLTTNFRDFPGHDWKSYERFWRDEQIVKVSSVIPVEGAPSEFTVSLVYERKGTAAPTHSIDDVWLQCNGNILIGRMPGFGCTQSHLQIDNTQPVQIGN